MQDRHNNRSIYFKELATTCKEYFMPYIQEWHHIEAEMDILEIGCGEGGNLLPFSEMGCHTIGVDIARNRIREAREFFKEAQAKGEFIANDVFKLKELEHKFDIIICHDVLEHLSDKDVFLTNLHRFLKPQGIVFMSFPAWQMPFGGHQQICRSKFISHLPFIHLLPRGVYRALLKTFGEDKDCIRELMSIKSTRISIETFEKLINKTNLRIENKKFWLINPHYKIKFGFKPRVLNKCMAHTPFIRNFFTSSCFYILRLT